MPFKLVALWLQNWKLIREEALDTSYNISSTLAGHSWDIWLVLINKEGLAVTRVELLEWLRVGEIGERDPWLLSLPIYEEVEVLERLGRFLWDEWVL